MNRRVVSLIALSVGLALVLSPFVLFPHAGEAECVNHVERIPESEVTSTTEVIQYGSLTPDAKRAFEAARTSPDGWATVYGENCPERFSYTDYTQAVVVEKSGTYYVWTASGGGGFFPIELLLSWAFRLVGVPLLVAGGVALRHPDAVPAAVLGTLGVEALVVAAANADLGFVTPWPALALVLVFGWVGVALPLRWALATGFGATLLAVLGFGLLGLHGSLAVWTLFPPAMVAVGAASDSLAARLRGRGPDRNGL